MANLLPCNQVFPLTVYNNWNNFIAEFFRWHNASGRDVYVCPCEELIAQIMVQRYFPLFIHSLIFVYYAKNLQR